MDFLQIQQGAIVNGRGQRIRLHGVNLGNWLLVEGYMLAGPNEPEHRIRRNLATTLGTAGARRYFHLFQKTYIQTSDLERIRRWGFNLVRVPVNYRLFFPSPEGSLYERSGWKRLDWLLRECARLKLYVLLDLHAAPGAQNGDWHSDSAGRAELWTSVKHQAELLKFWRQVAQRYRKNSTIAGYDLFNEPITHNKKIVRQLYERCLRVLRAAGDRHIVFIEGTFWSDDFEGLDKIQDTQLAYSPHFYKPAPFTFNTELDITYPGKIQGQLWNKSRLRRELHRFQRLGQRTKRPILIGEFGVNTRCSTCHAEARWVRDCVDLFKEMDFHWTYWAYKVLSSHMHPSGILRYPQNPAWMRREGTRIGWETWPHVTPRDRQDLLKQMDSRYFQVDQDVLKALQR